MIWFSKKLKEKDDRIQALEGELSAYKYLDGLSEGDPFKQSLRISREAIFTAFAKYNVNEFVFVLGQIQPLLIGYLSEKIQELRDILKEIT